MEPGEFSDDPESLLPESYIRESPTEYEDKMSTSSTESVFKEEIVLIFLQYHVLHDTWRINKTVGHQKRIESRYQPITSEITMSYKEEDVILKMAYLEQTQPKQTIVLDQRPEYERQFAVYSEGLFQEICEVLTGVEKGEEMIGTQMGLKYERKGERLGNFRMKIPISVCGKSIIH